MLKNQADSRLIPISEAAIILGVSKSNFYKRFRKREYEAISIVKYRAGWMADMMDVFRYGYPGVEDGVLAMLIYKYRADRLERRRKK